MLTDDDDDDDAEVIDPWVSIAAVWGNQWMNAWGEAMGHEGRERERERERELVCVVCHCAPLGQGHIKIGPTFPPPPPIKSLNCCPTSWHNLKTVHVDCSTPLNPLHPPLSPFPSTSTPPLFVRQALSLSLSFVVVALISFSSCLLCGQSFSREFQRLGCTLLSNYHKFGWGLQLLRLVKLGD